MDYFFVFMMIPYSIVARFIGTIIQTYFLNKRRAKVGEKLTFYDQIILLWCGLRGGIAFALAKGWTLPEEKSDLIVFATGVLCVFTILFYGMTMKPLIVKLKIPTEHTLESGYDYAAKVLSYPASNTSSFATGVLGHESKWSRFITKVDKGM